MADMAQAGAISVIVAQYFAHVWMVVMGLSSGRSVMGVLSQPLLRALHCHESRVSNTA